MAELLPCPVSQQAREAAANLSFGRTEARIRSGELDTCPIVQAFAQFERDTLERAAQWHSISTVPKDILTPVLLGYFHENFDGSIYEQGDGPVVARWHPKHGWLAGKERLNSDGHFSPTHWQHVPKPPRALKEPGR